MLGDLLPTSVTPDILAVCYGIEEFCSLMTASLPSPSLCDNQNILSHFQKPVWARRWRGGGEVRVDKFLPTSEFYNSRIFTKYDSFFKYL